MKTTAVFISLLALFATGFASPAPAPDAAADPQVEAAACAKVGKQCDGSPQRACNCPNTAIVRFAPFLIGEEDTR